MRILVTGASGFLGSHVADALSEAGHAVVIFDNRTSPYLRPDQEMIVGDILDPEAVAKAVAGCDAVYHFAALADINQALERPRDTINTNVIGTLNVLEGCRLSEPKRFVLSSSIYVYSEQGSFYRTSKQACENLVFDYADRFGLKYTILRYGSLYGPRADASNAVWRMLRQALEQGKIEYSGTGEEVREYIHVLDAAAMSLDILADAFENQIVHLTGRERLSTHDMLVMIREIMNNQVAISFGTGTNPGHYVQTPYSYVPKIGRKMTRDIYIDLGLGLLDCVQRLHAEIEGDA